MHPVERQTFIALKARRTAFRVVTDFLHLTALDVPDDFFPFSSVFQVDAQDPFAAASLFLRLEDHVALIVGSASQKVLVVLRNKHRRIVQRVCRWRAASVEKLTLYHHAA